MPKYRKKELSEDVIDRRRSGGSRRGMGAADPRRRAKPVAKVGIGRPKVVSRERKSGK